MEKDLFGNQITNNHWREEWQDMPEFVQEKQDCYQKIIVRFDSEKDVEEFAQKIGQKLTPLTQSIWYPKLVWKNPDAKRYIDES